MALHDTDKGDSLCRTEYELDNHTLFMRLAGIAATRSDVVDVKVGAVIVRNGRAIVSTGYNGHVQPLHKELQADESMDTVEDNTPPPEEDDKKLYVVHAAHNAILNTNGKDIHGCKLYVTRLPCYECAKLIINSGISEVIYQEKKTDEKIYVAGEKLLDLCPQVSHRTYAEALKDAGKQGESEEPRQFKSECDRPDWNQYFMAMAKIAAERSKDPRRKVGAVIVNADKRLVGIGYNGMPWGCEQALAAKWDKNNPKLSTADGWLDTKYPYVVHAVQMAIMNKNAVDLRKCSLYVTVFPDPDCTKSIIQARIGEVFYLEDMKTDDKPTEASKSMLKWAGVTVVKFESACRIELKLVDEDVTLIPGEGGEKWKFTSEPVAY